MISCLRENFVELESYRTSEVRKNRGKYCTQTRRIFMFCHIEYVLYVYTKKTTSKYSFYKI
jgi:hypothetical protein